jgi:pimeloyl-ACP methyl ester carboxylesterase
MLFPDSKIYHYGYAKGRLRSSIGKSNGTSMHVIETGNRSGQPILFLHGYPENWQAFEGVMNELTRYNTV